MFISTFDCKTLAFFASSLGLYLRAGATFRDFGARGAGKEAYLDDANTTTED